MSVPNPKASIVVREHGGRPFYEAFWRVQRKQVKRRIGPAWLERDPDVFCRKASTEPGAVYEDTDAFMAARCMPCAEASADLPGAAAVPS